MTRRGAIVGAGGVARLAHFPAYSHEQTRTGLVIASVVDSRTPPPDLAGLPVYPTIADALQAMPLDFVDICTPTSSHESLVLDALARGLHVFCEKPVAITPESARTMAAAARTAGRVLYPCHQYRQNPAWKQMQRWISDGAIGRWHLAEFHVYRAEADRGSATDAVPWRGRKAESMGGVLLDHGTHLLYLLLDVGGMPGAMHAHLSTLGHAAYDVEDTAHLLLDFGDRVATVTLTWAAQHRENRIRFIGSDGMVEWVGGQLHLVRRGHPVETIDFTAQLEKREYAGWMSRVLAQFNSAMDDGSSEASLIEIERVAALLDAAYRSSRDGCRVDLR